MELATIAQWLGTVGIVSFYPIQNWRLFMTRNPVGISFLAFCCIVVGVAGYLALGVRLELVGLAFGNASNFFFASCLLLIVWFRSSTLTVKERVAGLLVLISGLGFLLTMNLLSSEAIAIKVSGWTGLTGIVAFYPIQNAVLFRKKDPTGLSLLAFATLTIGLVFYTILGFLVYDITIIAGNGLTAIGSMVVICMILRYRK
jgi:uncharacterized protein with PQ loop repeat